MNACQDHLMTLGRAHGDRLALEAFQNGVARAPGAGLSETLAALSSLHALSRLEEDSGWYLETGYFESGKARAIRAQVTSLCGELAPSAVELVDAFALPDEVLEAPAGIRPT
jgi:acyl-CoA oxidase